MSATNKKTRTAPCRVRPTELTNGVHNIGWRGAMQASFDGFQPQQDGDNPLTHYLERNESWAMRDELCRILSESPRGVRRMAEGSAGRVIFSSREDGGLRATIHAESIEARACAAELRARGLAHFKRADEIERTAAQTGGAL